jgi:hypothetical protein
VRNPWCAVTKNRSQALGPPPTTVCLGTHSIKYNLHENFLNNNRGDLSKDLTQVNFAATASFFCYKQEETREEGGTMAGAAIYFLTETSRE